jgi:hypothetical protein
MKKFNLSSKVVVSDPCYEIPTWCQAVIENVLPGVYIGDADIQNEGEWGDRVAQIKAIHEDYNGSKMDSIKWSKHPNVIGVDSGQAGIFDFDHYRNDAHSNSYDLPLYFGNDWSRKNGDDWYQRMCNLTIEYPGWGTFSNGMNSTSGYGDGSYNLVIGTEPNGYVVGFMVIFIGFEDEEDF